MSHEIFGLYEQDICRHVQRMLPRPTLSPRILELIPQSNVKREPYVSEQAVAVLREISSLYDDEDRKRNDIGGSPDARGMSRLGTMCFAAELERRYPRITSRFIDGIYHRPISETIRLVAQLYRL